MRSGTVEVVPTTVILVLAGLLFVAGVLLFLAGRHVEAATYRAETRMAPAAPLANLVDDGLQRTRQAVDVLIQPDADPDEVRPSTAAHRNRGQTYQVLGLGLAGLAAVMVLGVLLLAG